jgi:hypothetical protein
MTDHKVEECIKTCELPWPLTRSSLAVARQNFGVFTNIFISILFNIVEIRHACRDIFFSGMLRTPRTPIFDDNLDAPHFF